MDKRTAESLDHWLTTPPEQDEPEEAEELIILRHTFTVSMTFPAIEGIPIDEIEADIKDVLEIADFTSVKVEYKETDEEDA